MPSSPPHPWARVKPFRRITGMSAVLLPFHPTGEVDWEGFRSHLERTVETGLIPAVNMDTGYVSLLDRHSRTRVLDLTAATCGSTPGAPARFVAGAFIADRPGAALDLDGYRREIDDVEQRGGLPVVFPSFGLTSLDGDGWVQTHSDLARQADRLIAFELGEQFMPCGRIYDIATFESLLGIDGVVGAKHSSLSRQAEWDRLVVRDRVRPGFLVLTGNDLAIDMVTYGSDYLLGLSSFAPDVFAERDRLWHRGDPGFYELNDMLQYLGQFAFRAPVPAYKHDCALFLRLRGWITSAATPPGALSRPDSDLEVLREIALRLGLQV